MDTAYLPICMVIGTGVCRESPRECTNYLLLSKGIYRRYTWKKDDAVQLEMEVYGYMQFKYVRERSAIIAARLLTASRQI